MAEASTVVVALDVGGTGIKCGLVDASGVMLATQRQPTGAQRGPAAVIDTIIDLAVELTAKARANGWDPVATGVVVPGAVDEAAGVARWSANIGFRGVPLRDLVSAATALPTALGHDVRAGALAESRWGAGRGADQMLFLTIGTGIAAAHVVGNVVNPGAHGSAGELGHVVVDPAGPVCGCGTRGCLETLASAAAIGRRYHELTGTAADAAAVATRSAAGDDVATTVWRQAIAALAAGLHTAVTLYDPDVVVVGGGLAKAGAALITPLADALRGRLTFQTEPRIVKAELGDEAGCLGAALLALRRVAVVGA
jgi:glucokinase